MGDASVPNDGHFANAAVILRLVIRPLSFGQSFIDGAGTSHDNSLARRSTGDALMVQFFRFSISQPGRNR
jgi:hypothetical protein